MSIKSLLLLCAALGILYTRLPPPPRRRDVLALDERTLAAALRSALAGSPAYEERDANVTSAAAPLRVIWTHDGDEVLVELGGLAVRLGGGAVDVTVDLESDETGRHALSVALVLGDDPRPTQVRAGIEGGVRGDPQLAARWGAVLERAVWSALLSVVDARASAAGGIAAGASVRDGRLRVTLQPPAAASLPMHSSAGHAA